ncbi:MAG: DNA/RNA non-specific endonuclease, partial [Janthinobacterium lividum]
MPKTFHDTRSVYTPALAARQNRHRHGVQRFLLAALVFCSTPAFASSTQCAAFFAGGEAPDLLVASLKPRVHALCFHFYSTAESGVTRTALWSAEKLTRDSVAGAQGETRVNAFHAESAIDEQDRADIADYKGSGYD